VKRQEKEKLVIASIAVQELLPLRGKIEPYQESRWAQVCSRLRTMTEKYDERLSSALTVARLSSGQYVVIDGLLRASMAKRDRGDNYHVECRVLTETTYEQRAELFWRLAKQRKNITALQYFFALAEARDKDALDIIKILSEYGMAMASPSSRKRSPYHIGAVDAVEEVYRMGLLPVTICTILSGMEGREDATDSALIKAVARVIRKGTASGQDVDLGILAEVLRAKSADNLVFIGRKLGAGNEGGGGRVAALRAGIIKTFNIKCHNSKNKRLEITWDKKKSSQDLKSLIITEGYERGAE
jgi:uncharacterized protein DUF6551